MENGQELYSDDDARRTDGYAQAIYLLNEKRELQARLREVDKKLRELEIATNGITRFAREDIERNARGLQACQRPDPA